MPLNSYEVTSIARVFQAARLVTEQIKPLIDNLDIVYNSAGGLKETINASDLGQDNLYGGMTEQQLDDAVYALTATIKGAVDTSMVALQTVAYRQ